MTRRQRRLTMIGGALLVLGIAVALVLNALRDSIVFFSTPVMVAENGSKPNWRRNTWMAPRKWTTRRPPATPSVNAPGAIVNSGAPDS